MEEEGIFKTDNLCKFFGKKRVLNNINLNIPKGSYFGIIGLSGSGKTTLINILIGFWKQTSGKVFFDGKQLKFSKKRLHENIGFATQGISVYPLLTVRENLAYFGRLYSMKDESIKKRTKAILDLMDLSEAENLLARELSTGMIRRLDIACSLIHNPKVLFLDEPTEDLDPVLRKEMLALIKKINDQGKTIIMTSHMLDEVEVVCSKIAIIHNGEIIECGSPDELKGKYSKNEEIHLSTTPGNYDSILKKLGKLDISNIVMKRNKIVLYTPKAEKVLKHLLGIIDSSREKIVSLKVHKPTMEEVFEYITKRH
ncbi:MAG: ABC transporter ATP-binding protein [Candidatus Nanoarchaeia archaeon]|nr:ABC transporter ATP-binding protein [Candidatus Nanoarchaeia archaeon]